MPGLQDAEDDGHPEHYFGMEETVYDDSLMAQHHPPTYAVLEGQVAQKSRCLKRFEE